MREADELAWARYERNMKGRGLSGETVAGARRALAHLAACLPAGVSLLDAGGEDVAAWLAAVRDDPGLAQSTHATYYRRAHAFYAWAEKWDYVPRSPMAKLETVKEHAKVIPLPDPAHLAAVLRACQPRRPEWRDRRDYAMLRILLEAGTPRAAELGRLEMARLDMRRDRITVFGKGGRERVIPFGEKTGHALTLWLRARGQHLAKWDAGRASPAPAGLVFFTKYGPMDRNGVYKVISARCRQASAALGERVQVPPHHWRHWSAHEWALAGGSEGDAMQLFGWSDPTMARRYASAAAASRAIEHAAARAQGDRL